MVFFVDRTTLSLSTRSTSIKNGISHLAEQVINPVSFESRIEEQIRELLGIEEVPEVNKEPDSGDEEDKFDDLSDEEKLVSDVSEDDDDGLFESRPIDGHSVSQDMSLDASQDMSQDVSQNASIKSERELDYFSQELNSFLNDKRNSDQVKAESVAVKTEKYESSISSTDEFDEMD